MDQKFLISTLIFFAFAPDLIAKDRLGAFKFRVGACNFMSRANDSFAKNNPGLAWDFGLDYDVRTGTNYLLTVDFLISQRTQLFESEIPPAYSPYFKPIRSRQLYTFGSIGIAYRRFLESKPNWFWATGLKTGFYLNPTELNAANKLIPIPRDNYHLFNVCLEGELGLRAFEGKEGKWHQFSLLLQGDLIGFKNNPSNDKNYTLLTYQLCYRLPI